MSASHFNFDANTGSYRHGHILVLSGYWGRNQLDELNACYIDLKQCLPRHTGPKRVTIHLMNFEMTLDAVTSALSILRRIFISDDIHISVVAEGSLRGAGVLFLIGAASADQRYSRKMTEDCQVEFSLKNAGWGDPGTMGFGVENAPVRLSVEQVCPEMRLLAPKVLQQLGEGEVWEPTPEWLLNEELLGKIIDSSNGNDA